MKTNISTLAAGFCLLALIVSCTDLGTESQVSNFNMDDFPYEIGTRWTYSVSDNLKSSTVVVTVAGKIDGAAVWIWQINDGYSVKTAYCSASGDTMTISYSEGEYIPTTYVFPLQAGERWPIPEGGNSTVVRVGSATVPAGNFPSCFQIIESSGAYSWLVPHVGIVKMTQLETQSGRPSTWELMSYDVP